MIKIDRGPELEWDRRRFLGGVGRVGDPAVPQRSRDGEALKPRGGPGDALAETKRSDDQGRDHVRPPLPGTPGEHRFPEAGEQGQPERDVPKLYRLQEVRRPRRVLWSHFDHHHCRERADVEIRRRIPGPPPSHRHLSPILRRRRHARGASKRPSAGTSSRIPRPSSSAPRSFISNCWPSVAAWGGTDGTIYATWTEWARSWPSSPT